MVIGLLFLLLLSCATVVDDREMIGTGTEVKNQLGSHVISQRLSRLSNLFIFLFSRISVKKSKSRLCNYLFSLGFLSFFNSFISLGQGYIDKVHYEVIFNMIYHA